MNPPILVELDSIKPEEGKVNFPFAKRDQELSNKEKKKLEKRQRKTEERMAKKKKFKVDGQPNEDRSVNL